MIDEFMQVKKKSNELVISLLTPFPTGERTEKYERAARVAEGDELIMVDYGKSLRQSARRSAGYEAAYLDYKKLKSVLREFDTRTSTRTNTQDGINNTTDDSDLPFLPASVSSLDGEDSEKKRSTNVAFEDIRSRFFEILSLEVEKMSLFVLQRQGDLADTIGTLRFEHDPVVSSLFHKEEEVLQKYQQTSFQAGRNHDEGGQQLETYLLLGVELLHLLQFVAINSVGIRKILKKYNKARVLMGKRSLGEPENI